MVNISLSYINKDISFSRRSKEVRQADVLERRTRAVFPMLSSTYVKDFYCALNKNTESIDPNFATLFEMLKARINTIKCDSQLVSLFSSYSAKNENYKAILKQVSQKKVGNCAENAKAALAVLFANGYYNSSRVGLEYEVKFLDKKTKHLTYSITKPLDHSFAITDLNSKEEQDIVIDPWLGFADNKQGAIARFKHIYKDELEEIKKAGKKQFYDLFHLKEGFNLDDYEMRTGFVFAPRERFSAEEKSEFSNYVRNLYPGVILDIKG